MKNEIAAPFGLAMTPCDVEIFNAFVLVYTLEILSGCYLFRFFVY